jgi:membrane fusion protein (multidrug efflux system)
MKTCANDRLNVVEKGAVVGVVKNQEPVVKSEEERMNAVVAKQHTRGGVTIAWLLAAVVLGGGVLGVTKLWPTGPGSQDAVKESKEEAIALVNVVMPRPGDSVTTINLPAGTQALRETTVYARTNGYVTKVLVDIGDKVKEGQVLAEIDSPEVDQALLQARANLEKAKANLELSKATLRRLETATVSGAVSRQEFDTQQAQTNVDLASVRVAQAEVDRLEIQKGYDKVIAPFDGVVTAKNIDPGALITSGSGSQVSSLFRVAAYETLKVFVDLPQNAVPSVKAGQQVNMAFREYPGRAFTGTVARLNGTLNAASRTRTVEVHLENKELTILPGEYVQVQFKVDAEQPTLIVPAGALVIGKQGPQVIVVGADRRLSYQAVKLGRDFGKEAEVVSGVTLGEQLVLNPTDRLRNGEEVRVKLPEVAAAR